MSAADVYECVRLAADNAAIDAYTSTSKGTLADAVRAAVTTALGLAFDRGLVVATDPKTWPVLIPMQWEPK